MSALTFPFEMPMLLWHPQPPPSTLSLSVCCVGDGNCFYRSFIAALLENLCQDPLQSHLETLSEAFDSQCKALLSCRDIDGKYKDLAVHGHRYLQVMLSSQASACRLRRQDRTLSLYLQPCILHTSCSRRLQRQDRSLSSNLQRQTAHMLYMLCFGSTHS